nr:MAG TPA: hypothetical protein [Caudoviricetes sp.]
MATKRKYTARQQYHMVPMKLSGHIRLDLKNILHSL